MWKKRKYRYSRNGQFLTVSVSPYFQKGRITSRRVYKHLAARMGVYVYRRKNGQEYYSFKLRRLKDRGF